MKKKASSAEDKKNSSGRTEQEEIRYNLVEKDKRKRRSGVIAPPSDQFIFHMKLEDKNKKRSSNAASSTQGKSKSASSSLKKKASKRKSSKEIDSADEENNDGDDDEEEEEDQDGTAEENESQEQLQNVEAFQQKKEFSSEIENGTISNQTADISKTHRVPHFISGMQSLIPSSNDDPNFRQQIPSNTISQISPDREGETDSVLPEFFQHQQQQQSQHQQQPNRLLNQHYFQPQPPPISASSINNNKKMRFFPEEMGAENSFLLQQQQQPQPQQFNSMPMNPNPQMISMSDFPSTFFDSNTFVQPITNDFMFPSVPPPHSQQQQQQQQQPFYPHHHPHLSSQVQHPPTNIWLGVPPLVPLPAPPLPAPVIVPIPRKISNITLPFTTTNSSSSPPPPPPLLSIPSVPTSQNFAQSSQDSSPSTTIIASNSTSSSTTPFIQTTDLPHNNPSSSFTTMLFKPVKFSEEHSNNNSKLLTNTNLNVISSLVPASSTPSTSSVSSRCSDHPNSNNSNNNNANLLTLSSSLSSSSTSDPAALFLELNNNSDNKLVFCSCFQKKTSFDDPESIAFKLMREQIGCFRTLQNCNQDGVPAALLFLDGTFCSYNAAFSRLVAYTPNLLADSNFSDLIHEEDKVNYLVDLTRAIAGQLPTFSSQLRFVTFGGFVVGLTAETFVFTNSIEMPHLMMIKVVKKDLTNEFASSNIQQKIKTKKQEAEEEEEEQEQHANNNNSIILNANGDSSSQQQPIDRPCEDHLYSHEFSSLLSIIEKILDQIAGKSSVPVMLYDSTGKISWTNSAWDTLLGLSHKGSGVMNINPIRGTAIETLTESVLAEKPETLTFLSPEVVIEATRSRVQTRCTGKRVLDLNQSLFGYLWFVKILKIEKIED